MLKIIGGERRGAKLQTLEGLRTRPLRGRVRESLFSIIQFDLQGARVLDLFAGSGAVGLEAVSRGAARSVFVEADDSACGVIRNNVAKLRYEDRVDVVKGCLPEALDSIPPGDSSFDLVFMMPPYGLNLARPVLEKLGDADVLAEDAQVIVEIEREDALPFTEGQGWDVVKDRAYGVTRLLFLRRV